MRLWPSPTGKPANTFLLHSGPRVCVYWLQMFFLFLLKRKWKLKRMWLSFMLVCSQLLSSSWLFLTFYLRCFNTQNSPTTHGLESVSLSLEWQLLSPVSSFVLRLPLAVNVYSVSQKSSPPKTCCYIFTQVKCIFVKFCHYVASLYLHIFTNSGRFILIFNKMALIFLGVPIVFNVFSFKFHQVKSP